MTPTLSNPCSNNNQFSRIYEPSEDANWEVAFVESIQPASTSSLAPSTSWRGEDTHKNKEHKHQHDKIITNNIMDSSHNLPIELSDIYEVEVPVTSSSPPAFVQPLHGLWSSDYIACPSPQYRAIPLYKVEGREDPTAYKDEGIDEPSSPLDSSPMQSGDTTSQDPQPSGTLRPPTPRQDLQPSGPPTPSQDPQPEEFIDSCDILQWVINDSNITPNILVGPDLQAPATITSAALEQNLATPTTINFITAIKTDEIPTTVPSPPLAQLSTTIKSEPEDSDWEPSFNRATSSRCAHFVSMTDFKMLLQAFLVYTLIFVNFIIFASKEP